MSQTPLGMPPGVVEALQLLRRDGYDVSIVVLVDRRSESDWP